ncbi:hypothetical protein BH23ACT7_BH23ACT7_03160 [soil metagenome]|jgi:predicted transcriptional regulator|nr:toxin-antitoxin system protein [Euzebyaceae bacterium]
MAMTIRLTAEQESRLQALATAHHAPKATILKQALDEKFEREAHRTRVREAAEFFRQRDTSLLERLADA